jgi:hypothetical protein
MVQAAQSAAQKIAQNVMLLALSRVMLAIGTPIMLSLLSWFALGFVNLEKTVAIQGVEQRRQGEQISELKQFRRDNDGIARQLQQDMATIREGMAAVQRGQVRIEAYIDRQQSGRLP